MNQIKAHSSPLAAYQALVTDGTLQQDDAQLAALTRMESLFTAITSDEFTTYHRKGRRFFSALRKAPDLAHHGCYLWGDVGRGKSMVMDLFYDMIPFDQKKRIHFHAFMRDVHERIHAWRSLKGEGELLANVVDELIGNVRVLCLDELQVHDVTDAMILSKLFTLLFDKQIVILFTSNRPPSELYQGGIQRDQFVQFIELAEKKMDIIELISPTDYRLEQLQSLEQTYFHPINDANTEQLYNIYSSLTKGHASEEEVIEVQGRQLWVRRTACGVAWMTFAELCERPLGANDYLELAARYHTLILQDIPTLVPEKRNEAKRFVTLIDALYEHKVSLICTAETAPDSLYPKGDGSFEFERTASRLFEMQSEAYLGASHII